MAAYASARARIVSSGSRAQAAQALPRGVAARQPLEQRLIRGYKPTPEEALVPRKRLLEKIDVWNRAKWAKGTFCGQKIRFVDGCASFRDYDFGLDEDTESGWPMKLRIDRNLVWKYGNRDYVMAHSDCAANINSEIKKDNYGGTDSLHRCWFLGQEAPLQQGSCSSSRREEVIADL